MQENQVKLNLNQVIPIKEAQHSPRPHHPLVVTLPDKAPLFVELGVHT